MLIDSSAWIEYLRATGSVHHLAVREAVAARDLHVADPVRLELLCGAAAAGERDRVETLLAGSDQLDQLPRFDVEAAGEIYRACRRRGETVRRPNDCLIAAIAIRHDVPVLHRDADFDTIARHTALKVVAP